MDTGGMKMRFLALTLALVFGALGCSSSQKKADTQNAPAAPAAKAASTSSASTAAAKPADASAKKNAKKAGAAGPGMACASGEDKRSIAVAKKGDGCEVSYTKSGETKVVATSANGTEHCDETVVKMKKNLEGAGFKCN
jgi:hypothetical protein